MKKRYWLIPVLLAVLAFVALTAAGVIPQATKATNATNAATTETASSYSEVTLEKGSITQNVIATGSLRYETEESLKLPEALTLASVDAEAGDAVTRGQALARYDTEALRQSLKEARDALTAQDETVLQLLGEQDSDQSVTAGIAGVVKQLNLKAGQPVRQTLQGTAAAVISTNGLMQVSITPSQPLGLGQEVRVKVGAQTQNGSVARMDADGSALVMFPDTRAKIDETVQVTLKGVTIGEGKAQVSLPYLLYTQLDGVVASVSVKVNSAVSRTSTIYQIKNAAPAQQYLDALQDREELRQTVQRYEALLADPVFRCESDGIVAAVSAQEGAALEKGSELLSLYTGRAFALDVAVDELDILSVQPGQEGLASLDAITDTRLPVTVQKISPLGTSSSGITSYTVTLSVKEDGRLRAGMNGTATLTVGETRDSVLVPLAALMSDRNGNYVLLKGEGEAGSEGAQGTKTYVEVGLSDASCAAVTGGLSEGDVVLVRSSALTGTKQTRQTQPGFGTMMNPDRQLNPGGGQRP